MQTACKDLMIMHRAGYFMLERIDYRRRNYEAVHRYPDSVMSCIIDGASMNHCTIPHPGNIKYFHIDNTTALSNAVVTNRP